jgi:hypothetical protein
MTATTYPFDGDDRQGLDDDRAFWLEVELPDLEVRLYNPLLKAEISAKGAGVRASTRAALLHPVALTLLGASLMLAAALHWLPTLRPWSDRAAWVALLGVAAYLAVVAVAHWSRSTPMPAEIRHLRRIRQSIAALLADRQDGPKDRQDPVLIGTLKDAIRHLDEQVIPALEQLIGRQEKLRAHLARYDRGELHAPEPGVLERLRAIYARQQAAIHECVQQAANAHATLVALLQEGDDTSIGERARTWADGLLTLYDSLAEVLRGTDQQAPTGDTAGRAPGGEPAETTASSAPAAGTAVQPGESPVALVPLVDEALRRVRTPARLTECGLIAQLPLTVGAACQAQRNGRGGAPTPLEQAHALRQVLISAVERLRPADAPDSRGSRDMLHGVLDGVYLKGMSIRQTMSQFSISESTLHRYRREGIRVLAQELGEQEESFRLDQSRGAGD